MKQHTFFLLGGLCASLLIAAQAQAGNRIPNLSMTPSEMRNEGLNRNTTNNYNNNNYNNNINTNNSFPNNSWQGSSSQLPGAMAPTTPNMANNYMDGFCDPNFQPILSRNASYARIASCLAQLREQACGLYRNLPADAKGVVDQSVNCLSQSSGSTSGGLVEAPDGTLQPAPPSQATTNACFEADSARLQMLKRYWDNQQVAYAIVFVPDLAMDNSGRCISGGL